MTEVTVNTDDSLTVNVGGLASHDHDGAYVSQSEDDQRWLWSSAGLVQRTGSPTMVNVFNGRHTGWELVDASTNGIKGDVFLPPWWTTFDFAAWWSHSSGSTGDVVFDHFAWDLGGDGDSGLGTPSSSGSVTDTALADDTVTVTTIATGVSITTGRWGLHLDRLGGDAADTLAGDIFVIAFQLVRAS